MKRGDWTPAHLTRGDCTFLVGLVMALALFRAADYIVGMDDVPRMPVDGKPPTVSLLESAFALVWYGVALIVTNGILFLGGCLRRHVIVWLGHGLCMVAYFVLFVGTIVPVFDTPYLDGVRGATALLGPMFIHGLFWLRTGPKPLTLDEGTTIETQQVRKPK